MAIRLSDLDSHSATQGKKGLVRLSDFEEAPGTPSSASTPTESIKSAFDNRVQKPNILDKIFKDNPVMRVVNYPFAKMAEFATPDAPMIGRRADGTYGNLPGTNAREQWIKENPVPSTGNKTLDTIGNVTGGLLSAFTPGMGPSINAYSALPLVQMAGHKAGGLGASLASKLSDEAEPGIEKLVSKVFSGATKGTLEGIPQGIQYNMSTTNATAKDAGEGAVGGLIFGAGFGGVGGALGTGLEKIATKYAGKKLGDALGKWIGAPKVEPDVPTVPVSTPPTNPLALPPASRFESVKLRSEGTILPTNETPIFGRGDVHTFELPDPTIPNTLADIRQATYQQITPPLENPNELAKWVQSHLGIDNISLNEIRKLPYEDLRDMASMMRDRLKPMEVAKKIADERGYDLSELMQGRAVTGTVDSPANIISFDNPGFQKKPPKGKIQEPESPFEIDDTIDYPFENVPPPPKEAGTSPTNKVEETPSTTSNPDEDILNIDPDPRIRDRVMEYFDEVETAARARLQAKRNTLSSMPFDQWRDMIYIGGAKLAKGTIKFADWSEEMIREFGEQIKPHLKEIFKRSKLEVKEADRRAAGVAHLPGVNQGIDPLGGNQELIAKLNAALENSHEWKDKSRFFLNRETTDRNFEDVMGKDADIMNRTYFDPIQEAAANRQRWIAKERSDIKDLGIKYKSKDDALVQEYGEGLITLEQLQDRSPDNWQNVKLAAETMRSKYDEYLTMANEVLARNGYEEIPKRKDYFPHYDEIDGWLDKLGFGFEDNTLPAELNGLTANLRPGKNFFNHFLQRTGDETTLGALAGHDRYIEGISKVIHQTDNIRRLRGLDKSLREKSGGTTHLSNFLGNLTDYINVLAGKKTELDRSLEAGIGRNLYSAVDWMKRRVGGNMIGGSISSALTNSIPVTQLLAETSKDSVLKGLASALQNIKGGDEIAQASNFLARRFPSEKLAMGKLDKTQKVAGSLFTFMDQFTSNMVIRSKYYENIKNGMQPKDAMKAADKYASRMMADRSEGSMPTLFHSRTFGLVTQFQLEVNNQLSHLFKDMPRGMSKAKYASAITQVFVYDYLYNQIYEKLTGNRPAFDPIGIAIHAFDDFSDPLLSDGKAEGHLIKGISNNLPFASTIAGGRIPVSAAIPNFLDAIQGKANLVDEVMKPVKYLALPFGGSQINKTITGLTNLGINPFYSDESGSYTTDAKGNDLLEYPIDQTPANYLKGSLFGKYAFPEAREYMENDRRPLNVNETRSIENAGKPSESYSKIIKSREIDKIIREIDTTREDDNLSREQKLGKVRALQEKLQEIRMK